MSATEFRPTWKPPVAQPLSAQGHAKSPPPASRYTRGALPAVHTRRSSGVQAPQGASDAFRSTRAGSAAAKPATAPRATLAMTLAEDEEIQIEHRVVHLPVAADSSDDVGRQHAEADDPVPPPPPDAMPLDQDEEIQCVVHLPVADSSNAVGLQHPEADDPVPPPPPDDVSGFLSSPSAATALTALVQGLALDEKLAALSDMATRAMDPRQQRADRLGEAGTRFIHAASTSFKAGQAFDANGKVANPSVVTRHVIGMAARLNAYEGVREQANQTGLGRQPIDLLVESTRSQMVPALKALVDSNEFDLRALDKDELKQLEQALGSLGIRLGSNTDRNHPRTELGRKLDQANKALGFGEHRARRAHENYVPPADEGANAYTPVLSKDINIGPTKKLEPTKAKRVEKKLAQAAQKMLIDQERRLASEGDLKSEEKKKGVLGRMWDAVSLAGMRARRTERQREQLSAEARETLKRLAENPTHAQFGVKVAEMLPRLDKSVRRIASPESGSDAVTQASFSAALAGVGIHTLHRIAGGLAVSTEAQRRPAIWKSVQARQRELLRDENAVNTVKGYEELAALEQAITNEHDLERKPELQRQRDRLISTLFDQLAGN